MKWHKRYQNPIIFLKDVVTSPKDTARHVGRSFREGVLAPFNIPLTLDCLETVLEEQRQGNTDYPASRVFGKSLGYGLATALYVELAFRAGPLEKVHDYLVNNPEFIILPIITNLTALVAKYFQNQREKLAEKIELERIRSQCTAEAEAARAEILEKATQGRRTYKFGPKNDNSGARTKIVTFFSQPNRNKPAEI